MPAPGAFVGFFSKRISQHLCWRTAFRQDKNPPALPRKRLPVSLVCTCLIRRWSVATFFCPHAHRLEIHPRKTVGNRTNGQPVMRFPPDLIEESPELSIDRSRQWQTTLIVASNSIHVGDFRCIEIVDAAGPTDRFTRGRRPDACSRPTAVRPPGRALGPLSKNSYWSSTGWCGKHRHAGAALVAPAAGAVCPGSMTSRETRAAWYLFDKLSS